MNLSRSLVHRNWTAQTAPALAYRGGDVAVWQRELPAKVIELIGYRVGWELLQFDSRPGRFLHRFVLLVMFMLVALQAAVGADPTTVYVNNCVGADANNGLAAQQKSDGGDGPVATITRALALVPVGGCISIANTGRDYREAVSVQKLFKGRAATPLVIDGHGATVSGLMTIPAARWTQVKDDLYVYAGGRAGGVRAPMPNSNWLAFTRHQGWFTEPQAPRIFFLNGAPAPHVTRLADIPPGGFFYETQDGRKVYFRLPAGKALSDCAIDIPQNTGVLVDDDYVVVRNLASRYSQDDGFSGFWGIGDVFENCNASDNCDQGFSFHGTSVTVIDGGVIERNGGCGIADVMSSFTVYRNVVVRDNMFAGALLQGLGHSLLSCRFSCNRGPQVSAEKGAVANLTNCLIVGDPAAGATIGIQLDRGHLDRCTIINCVDGVLINGGGTLRNSILADCTNLLRVAPAAMGQFQMEKSLFNGGRATLGATELTAATWAECAKTNAGIANNSWADPQLNPRSHMLPANSPYRTAGQYNQPVGAVLLEFPDWPATPAEPFRHPHP